MPDLEAVGDAVTGGVIGRAVEPAAGEGDGHTHEGQCLNCGTELVGDYCHSCGQRAHVHRTLSAFWHDFLHGVLHFEGKIWRTLPLLAWQPGQLTRRYIEGERASFVSPIALFLFSVFLMFAVAGFTVSTSVDVAGVQAKLETEQKKAETDLAKLERARAETASAGRSTASIDRQIEELKRELEGIKAVRGGDLSNSSIQFGSGARRAPRTKEGEALGNAVSRNADPVIPSWLDTAYRKAKKNPELLFYKLKTNAYKFSWALIPLSVPFLWLLFPFSRRYRLYDHTVFVTYSLSFMTLLVVTALLVSATGLKQVAALAVFVPPIHMYRQLRGAYSLGRFGALWRTVVLSFFSILAISFFILGLIVLGVI